MFQQVLQLETPGRGVIEITGQVQSVVAESGVEAGLCHLFIQHTSASIILCENAAPEVRTDLETFMARVVPDADPAYLHCNEGPDDMPAHVRTVLTKTDITLPVTHSACALGTWQGVFLWEHRTQPHRRRVCVTVFGAAG